MTANVTYHKRFECYRVGNEIYTNFEKVVIQHGDSIYYLTRTSQNGGYYCSTIFNSKKKEYDSIVDFKRTLIKGQSL